MDWQRPLRGHTLARNSSASMNSLQWGIALAAVGGWCSAFRSVAHPLHVPPHSFCAPAVQRLLYTRACAKRVLRTRAMQRSGHAQRVVVAHKGWRCQPPSLSLPLPTQRRPTAVRCTSVKKRLLSNVARTLSPSHAHSVISSLPLPLCARPFPSPFSGPHSTRCGVLTCAVQYSLHPPSHIYLSRRAGPLPPPHTPQVQPPTPSRSRPSPSNPSALHALHRCSHTAP